MIWQTMADQYLANDRAWTAIVCQIMCFLLFFGFYHGFGKKNNGIHGFLVFLRVLTTLT
jgi:hypothetical protein